MFNGVMREYVFDESKLKIIRKKIKMLKIVTIE